MGFIVRRDGIILTKHNIVYVEYNKITPKNNIIFNGHNYDYVNNKRQILHFTMKQRYLGIFTIKRNFIFDVNYYYVHDDDSLIKICIHNNEFFNTRTTFKIKSSDFFNKYDVVDLFIIRFKSSIFYRYIDDDNSLKKIIHTFNVAFGV